MILLVDSGSTKTDWVLLDSNKRVFKRTETMGFNPHFHSSTLIAEAIKQNHELTQGLSGLQRIEYFGAGCSNEKGQLIIKEALNSVFPDAEVNVQSDMMAAVFATYAGNPAICCILGTGSNAAYFDGESIRPLNAGFGYILGDEGSGSYFGKKLLAAYLYGQLPAEIGRALENEFALTPEGIVQRVYEQKHANVYLAGFSKFIGEHLSNPLLDTLVCDGMKEFLTLHIINQVSDRSLPVHFVGSVAYSFQEQLLRVCQQMNIQPGTIMKSPINGLVEYYGGIKDSKDLMT